MRGLPIHEDDAKGPRDDMRDDFFLDEDEQRDKLGELNTPSQCRGHRCQGRRRKNIRRHGIFFSFILMAIALFALHKHVFFRFGHFNAYGKTSAQNCFCGSRPISSYPTVVRNVQLKTADTLNFMETLDLPARIEGTIYLVPKESTGDNNFDATVSISASDDGKMLESIQLRETNEGLELTNVKHHKGRFFRQPCLYINVTLAIDPDTELDRFDVHSHHLSVHIDPSFSLAVKETTTISVYNGKVRSPAEPTSFTSRETNIEVRNGDIIGKYSLYDSLSLYTHNGRVGISVVPKPESDDEPRAARLGIKASNGEIEVDVVMTDLPRRGYVTDINSGNGNIKGSVVHGAKTCIYARNGHLDIEVTPVHSGEDITHLMASTGNEDIIFTLKNPVSVSSDYVDDVKSAEDNDPDAILGKIHSEHQSFNGQLQLHYPAKWKGQYHGSTLNGRIIVTDEGKTVVDNDGSHVSGQKGEDGTADIKFSTLNGRVELHLG